MTDRNSKGQFVKGIIPWSKTNKFSEETLKRMSENHKGQVSPMKGKKHTPESIEKMKQSHKGAKAWNKGKKFSLESRKKMSESQKKNPNRYWLGKHHSPEHRAKIDGENSNFWKGGVTPINKKIRQSLKYRTWRETIFKRDDYTCQICGERGKEIHADHIKEFSNYPDLRFELTNGRTLCADCHRQTDNYGPKAKQLIMETN